MSNNKEIRVRFAPSPTGELHIGGLRTALTNFLFARSNRGKFVLRIEDTDQKRYVEGAVERILKALKWAGTYPDEGVVLSEDGKTTQSGEFGPYIQSERKEIYQKYIRQLVDEGRAYYCFCSSERLDEMRKEQMRNKQAPKYDRKCINLSKEEVEERIKNGENCVVRFKIPEGKTEFKDLVYGKIEVDNKNIDDQIILKADGLPTYHLAVVVDDHLMEISHVFRGAEWLPSTPKHILLYKAFGWEKNMPEFCHMPNILNKSRKKLSKREGSVSVEDFRTQGYPPQAVVNFIALLGWNPKTEQEIFTLEELIEQFDTAKMNKAGGVFDMDRLNWISAQHIKKMSKDELYAHVLPFLEEKDFYKDASEVKKSQSYIKKVLTVEKDRMEKFTQVGEDDRFFFSDSVKVSPDEMRWKESEDEDTKEYLKKAHSIFQNIPEEEWTLENLEGILLKEAGEKRGELLFPLRAALTGEKKSPSPFEVAWVLGKKESLQRIESALDTLE